MPILEIYASDTLTLFVDCNIYNNEVTAITAQVVYGNLRPLTGNLSRWMEYRFADEINYFMGNYEQELYWDEDSADDRRRGICY